MFQGCFLLTAILILILLCCYSVDGEISPSGSTRTFSKIFNLIGIVAPVSESKAGPVSETQTQSEQLTTLRPLNGNFNNQEMIESLQNRLQVNEGWTIPRLGWDYDNM